MTLKDFDGFDNYATAQLLDNGFTDLGLGFVTIISSDFRYGTQCLSSQGSDVNQNRRYLGISSSTWYVGAAIKFSGSFNVNLLSFYDSTANTNQLNVQLVNGTNTLRITNGAGTTLGTSTATFSLGAWNYIEVGFFIHDTLGWVTLRLQENTILTITGVDTRNGTPSTVDTIAFYRQGAAGNTCYFDDYYACDDQGTENNGFLGDIRVESLFPTGAGNYSQFTPSTGSNWQNVDDATPNGDTDYNSSSTAGQKDSFTYSNLSSTVSTIYGLKYKLYTRKDNAGGRSITPLQRQSATDYTGTTVPLTDSYTTIKEIKERNPATGNKWTQSDIDTNAEFGYEIVT